MQYSKIEQLIYIFSKLPGIGPRSARRIVLHMLKYKENIMMPLSDLILDVSTSTHNCKICGNLDDADICRICTKESRDKSIICVVESVADLWALERGKFFNGHYHILGGTLSASGNRSPEDLNINKLVERVTNNGISEVIIATNATIDGQTTAFYITDQLKHLKIKISRLASGIPIGGELDYLDDGTLIEALNSRKPFLVD